MTALVKLKMRSNAQIETEAYVTELFTLQSLTNEPSCTFKMRDKEILSRETDGIEILAEIESFIAIILVKLNHTSRTDHMIRCIRYLRCRNARDKKISTLLRHQRIEN